MGADYKVLGWDAAGRVVEKGDAVTDFAVGDEVFYAGSLLRPGANSAFHLVESRIVGRKPATLTNAEAVALPLTAITAWEMLFDRLDIRRPVPGAANARVIIGGAGGFGSITIQLARALTDVTVIATASRPETQDWVRALGAHEFLFSTTETHRHLAEIQTLIAPQGRFGLIDDPVALDVIGFKRKAVSIHWELMFTRSIYGTPDMPEQGRLLNDVARLIDEARIRTTLTEVLSPIDAADIKRVHTLIESGKARGKIVLEGF